MVLTDPPYGIKYKSKKRKKGPQFDMLLNDDNSMRFEAYPELHRVIKNNAVAIIFASWKNCAQDFFELQKLFDIKNVIVWWKHGGGMGDLKHTLASDYELAIVCHKGKCDIRGKRIGSVWECNKVTPSSMVHPTQKPVQLMAELIKKYTDEEATILDCFMGSGSTGVACVNTNRNFIGMEMDERYFNIAQERIDTAMAKCGELRAS